MKLNARHFRLLLPVLMAAFTTAALLFLPFGAAATKSVVIKMVLNNAQAKTVREAKGRIISLPLTTAQRELVRVRAPKYQGSIIRVSSGQLSPTNKIHLQILKPDTATPVLRVVKRGAIVEPADSTDALAPRSVKPDPAIVALHERLDALARRLEELRAQLAPAR